MAKANVLEQARKSVGPVLLLGGHISKDAPHYLYKKEGGRGGRVKSAELSALLLAGMVSVQSWTDEYGDEDDGIRIANLPLWGDTSDIMPNMISVRVTLSIAVPSNAPHDDIKEHLKDRLEWNLVGVGFPTDNKYANLAEIVGVELEQ